MNVIADQYLYKLAELIPGTVELSTFDPNDGHPDHAVEFDALLVRTVTKINAKTLPSAGNLKFIGTATAGFDHMDTDHLKQLGITFGRAAGCNARAVAEYVITCLYHWADEKKTDLHQKKVGVVGCGHTGGALIELLKKLNISFEAYDPPKAESESDFKSASHKQLLECDILSFHTPLTTKGNNATYHMCDKTWLSHKFDLIINAARGGVVHEAELLKSYRNNLAGDYILDVWENEPFFSDEVAENAFIATPHIAGYSREAKFRASKMIVEKMCRFFDLQPKPNTEEKKTPCNKVITDKFTSFSDFLWKNNQVQLYHDELRKLIGLPADVKENRFATLRAETSTRFEYRSILEELYGNEPVPDMFEVFQ